jgi:hypothetical protein
MLILFASVIRGRRDAAQPILAEQQTMAADRAALAEGRARQETSRRPPRDQRHRACDQERQPLVRLPPGIWSTDDDLQSLRALGRARRVGANVPRTCGTRTIGPDTDDRLHPPQGAPLGLGRKTYGPPRRQVVSLIQFAGIAELHSCTLPCRPRYVICLIRRLIVSSGLGNLRKRIRPFS